MRVRDLLDVPGLGLRLLTDVSGVDRVVQHVYTTDLPDPSRYLTPGDLVLTGMIWCREPRHADRFVRALARAGAVVLGAGKACSGSWNACAATMYVHVNTVRYRIRRIEDLTRCDLSGLDDQVDFFLALQIR